MVVAVGGIYHDDGVYISTAKALAQGQGYHLINLPDAPVQTKYPLLYPALLALIWKLWPAFPDNLLAMQWLTLLFGAVTVGMAYLYMVRCHSRVWNWIQKLSRLARPICFGLTGVTEQY